MSGRGQANDARPLTDADYRAAASLLRGAFSDTVSGVELPAQFATQARARARRITASRRVAVAAAAAVVVAVGSLGAVARTTPHHPAASRVDALTPSWPARGNLAHDKATINAALRAWDSGAGGHHALRSVLFAGTDGSGDTVVLVATDASGQLRVGGFHRYADAASYVLLRDQAVSAPLDAIALVEKGPGGSRVVFLLTDPAFTSVSWQDVSPSGVAASAEPWADPLFGGIDVITFDTGDVPPVMTIFAPDGRHADVSVDG